MSFLPDLPQYAKNPDYQAQEYYHELLNRILYSWFNNNGFSQPVLTNAQVAVIVALNNPLFLGKHWFNSDLNAEQFMGNANTTQVVTSV